MKNLQWKVAPDRSVYSAFTDDGLRYAIYRIWPDKWIECSDSELLPNKFRINILDSKYSAMESINRRNDDRVALRSAQTTCPPAEQTTCKFWLVWCPSGQAPNTRHTTMQSAIAEAERLAEKNPVQEFIVLEAMSASKATKPVTTTETL